MHITFFLARGAKEVISISRKRSCRNLFLQLAKPTLEQLAHSLSFERQITISISIKRFYRNLYLTYEISTLTIFFFTKIHLDYYRIINKLEVSRHRLQKYPWEFRP